MVREAFPFSRAYLRGWIDSSALSAFIDKYMHKGCLHVGKNPHTDLNAHNHSDRAALELPVADKNPNSHIAAFRAPMENRIALLFLFLELIPGSFRYQWLCTDQVNASSLHDPVEQYHSVWLEALDERVPIHLALFL